MSSTIPSKRPLIGCTTYRKTTHNSTVPMMGLATAYIESVQAAGGIPLLITLGLDEASLEAILAQVDGILLPGGGDINPSRYNGGNRHATLRGIDDDRDWMEMWLARAAVAGNIPLLAICRGHQIFNVAMGGTLWQDVESQTAATMKHDFYQIWPRHHLAHQVSLTAGSCLAGCLPQETVQVNSLHHQGIRELAPGLTATAVAPDGLIEGIEAPDHPFALGVQWHPENLIGVAPAMLGLFRGLVDAARNRVK